MAYSWCNWKYCKTCGGTNRWFYTMPQSKVMKKPWISKECKECYLERFKKYIIAYRDEEYKRKQREYANNRVKNSLYDKKKHAENNRRYRLKLKNKKLLERNRELTFLRGGLK